jgi:hypothetical protein
MIRNGCSSNATPVDGGVTCAVGDGSNFTGLRYGLEPLLERYQVDMYFTGHIHMYERSLPVMRGQVEQSYHNPKGVVHINTGNSGGRTSSKLHSHAVDGCALLHMAAHSQRDTLALRAGTQWERERLGRI